jgi:hypothetical protein
MTLVVVSLKPLLSAPMKNLDSRISTHATPCSSSTVPSSSSSSSWGTLFLAFPPRRFGPRARFAGGSGAAVLICAPRQH